MPDIPTNPYGIIGEYRRDPEPPPYNRPDVPVNPPEAGYNTHSWHAGETWADEDLPWLRGRST